jgi:hypothetical protein
LSFDDTCCVLGTVLEAGNVRMHKENKGRQKSLELSHSPREDTINKETGNPAPSTWVVHFRQQMNIIKEAGRDLCVEVTGAPGASDTWA